MRKHVRVFVLLLVFIFILFCQFLSLKAEGASLGLSQFVLPKNENSNARLSNSSPSSEADSSVDSDTSSQLNPDTFTPEKLATFRRITSPEAWNQLAELVNTGIIDTKNKEFFLDANLDFGSSKVQLMPIGTQQYPFAGRFQGKGHRIYGITDIAPHNGEFASLFGYTQNAVIADVGVETTGEGLTGKYSAGFISVAEGNTEIRSSYFSGTLSGTISGGFVADVQGKLHLFDCYAISMLHHKTTDEPPGAAISTPTKSGILVGTLSGTEKSTVSVQTSFGLSPDLSISGLFGPSVSPDNLTLDATFLFDIRSDELLKQMSTDSLEAFDFEDVWKQPEPDMFPILRWQKNVSGTRLTYSYTVGTDDPVIITPGQPPITINSGDPAIYLSVTPKDEPLTVYSNLTRDESGRYAAELTKPEEEVHAAFLTLKNGQLTAAELSFVRIDSNKLFGTIQGLNSGDHYTVSLESVGRPAIRFSETFSFDTQGHDSFVMAKIPEGNYRLLVTAPGYLEEERKSIAVNSRSLAEQAIFMYRSIEIVSLENVPPKRVEPLSTNRISVALTPKDAPVSFRETKVLLLGAVAPENSYTLEWQGNDLLFTPKRSGEFTVGIHIYDAHSNVHRSKFVVNAYRKVTGMSLPQSVEISGNEKTLEITAKIQPADATETKLKWTIISGSDCLSLASSGLSCTLTPRKVGTANILVESIDGITRTIRVRVLDKEPAVFSEPVFEKTAAMDRMMACFSVRDDCGLARVVVVKKKTGEAVSVSQVAAKPDGYAFEAEHGIEYTVTALDINGNQSEATMMVVQPIYTNNLANSGLAVSKSSDSVSLWVSANDLIAPDYTWEKKTKDNDWETISGGTSKMVESGLLPNTWYEYRVIVRDETGKEVTKTSAVRTNPVPIQAKDIEISVGSSYQSVYVGEQFPIVSLINGQVDVTGQNCQWIYDDDVIAPEAPSSNLFMAKEPGTHILECIQTDAFGQTSKQTTLLTIQSFDTTLTGIDQRLFLMILSMAISLVGLFFLALVRRVQELKVRL